MSSPSASWTGWWRGCGCRAGKAKRPGSRRPPAVSGRAHRLAIDWNGGAAGMAGAAGARGGRKGGRDMRSWLAAFTTRGTSFLAAGAAAAIAGLFLGERDLVSVGVLLLVLPMFSALAAGRARYRLSCTRSVIPPRVAAGQTAQVLPRLENVSRLPTGLLLAEDTVPSALGTRPRYVLNGIERGRAPAR